MKNKVILELIWWLFTIVIALLLLYPILSSVPSYPFFFENLIFIFVFITFTRYTFLLRHTFLANRQVLKIAWILSSVIIIFLLVQEINSFQTFLDENGWQAVIGQQKFEQGEALKRYVYNEMLFFSVGSVLSAIILPIRLLISVWRVKNLGAV